jgi:hypothetical protein
MKSSMKVYTIILLIDHHHNGRDLGHGYDYVAALERAAEHQQHHDRQLTP